MRTSWHIVIFLLFPAIAASGEERPRPRVPYECPGMSGGVAVEIATFELACDKFSPETKAKRARDLDTLRHDFPGCYEELTNTDEFRAFEQRSKAELATSTPSTSQIASAKANCAKGVDAQSRFNGLVESAMPRWPEPKPKPKPSSSSKATPDSPYPQVRAELIASKCALPDSSQEVSASHPHPYFREISCGAENACTVTFKCPDMTFTIQVVLEKHGVFVAPEKRK